MNPYDRIYGAEPRRFLRFVYEFEVEVTDPTQAAAYTMDLAHNEAGELGMAPHPNQNGQMAAAVGLALGRGLDAAGPQAGFKALSGSLLSRPVADDGQHSEMTFPPQPARLDDGSIP